jgi:hypothetical protein
MIAPRRSFQANAVIKLRHNGRQNVKNKRIILTAFSVVAFAVGCKPAGKQPTVGDSSSPQLERVKKETKEAAQALNDYAYAQRVEFAEKMKIELAALNKEMDQLAVKIENSSGDTKAEAKAKLQALRDKAAELNVKLAGSKMRRNPPGKRSSPG